MKKNLTVETFGDLLGGSISELSNEAEFARRDHRVEYATDKDGSPLLKMAIGNVPLDYDLWDGLRNPAVVGLYPVGLREIWEFQANHRKQKVDANGRITIFQVPRSFEDAVMTYSRALIISVMLPLSPDTVHDYVGQVINRKHGSSFEYLEMYRQLNRMLDKGVDRAATRMITDDIEKVIVPMTNDNVKAVSVEAVPQTRQGISHGPSKGGNFPQKSLAVLMGLGQFGISRMIIRDEIRGQKVERFAGPIRSVIIFDKNPVITDGTGGVMYPTPHWRRFLFDLFDFTNVGDAVNRYRFCAHFSANGKSCNKCADYCPSGAQMNSTPGSNGKYSDVVSRQLHRFWNGKLQFDFARCSDEKEQMASLFPEWSCGRCLTVCIDQGVRKKQAVRDFYQKLAELSVMSD